MEARRSSEAATTASAELGAESTCSGDFIDSISTALHSDDEECFAEQCATKFLARKMGKMKGASAGCEKQRCSTEAAAGQPPGKAFIAPPPGLELLTKMQNHNQPSHFSTPGCSSARHKLRENGHTVLMSVQRDNQDRRGSRDCEDGDASKHCRSRKSGGRNTVGNYSTALSERESRQRLRPNEPGYMVASERHAALLRVLDSRKADKEVPASQSKGCNPTSAVVPSLWRSARTAIDDAVHLDSERPPPLDAQISSTQGFARRPPGNFGQHDDPNSADGPVLLSGRAALQKGSLSNYSEPMKVPVSEFFGEVVSL